jgi:CheY-like chemotaxis protein
MIGQSVTQPNGSGPATASASLLVVDDNNDIRFLIGRHLRREFRVAEADCGPAALSYLAENDPPDLIVLDVQMPDMDGWQTLRAIRADPRTAAVPVVMCTVKASPEDVARAEELGANGYVVKPFSLADLVDAVRGALDRRELVQAGAGAKLKA